jgi:hypothetical protein
MADTPRDILQAALDQLGERAVYVRVEANDLRAMLNEQPTPRVADRSAAEALSADAAWAAMYDDFADPDQMDMIGENRSVAERHRPIIEAALDRERAAALPTLEVERLARALSAYWANRYGKDDVSARMELNRPAAEELAREYAALSDDVSPGVSDG